MPAENTATDVFVCLFFSKPLKLSNCFGIKLNASRHGAVLLKYDFFFKIYLLFIRYTTFLPHTPVNQKGAPDLVTEGCELPYGC